MNKTVTINISGIIFHIEEDAFERLQSYLSRVRSRFSAEEGRDEIMTDIESRIAEILNERVGPSKQVVVMADVDHVISLMGEPEAISDNEEQQDEKKEETFERRQEPGRRYRRRLFRDPDDKVVGGVCSGLGYYFDIDPVWIRLGFAVIFFAFGSGVLFYLLLMIIVPKAESTAEKLEMRGEPVDVNNISRTIKEEFEGFKRRVEDFGNDPRFFGRRRRSEHFERRSARIRTGAEEFFNAVFRVIGRIFAFLLIVFGVLLLIGLLTSTFSLSDFGPDLVTDSFHNVFSNSFTYNLAICAILLTIGIPTLMMIYKGIRLMFRIARPDRPIGIIALVLWIIGIVIGSYCAIDAARSFSDEAGTRDRMAITTKDTLYVRVNIDQDMLNQDYNSRMNRKHRFARRYKMVSNNGNVLKLGDVDLTIVPSDNDSAELVIYRSSRGSTKREALSNAKSIIFPVTITDSLIQLNSCFMLQDQSRWRAQEVHAELRIPKNTVVYLHSSTRDMLYDVDNVTNTLDQDMADRRWKMTPSGLMCIDCAGLEIEETEILRRAHEEAEREEKRRIEQLRKMDSMK
jgi:phage shock protein PspC (stress-responsive transcriptional regulator)